MGISLGTTAGRALRIALGVRVGMTVGITLLITVGGSERMALGAKVGISVGIAPGFTVGRTEGAEGSSAEIALGSFV